MITRRIGVLVGFAVLLAVGPQKASAQALGFISTWGGLGAGDGQFNTPVGVAIDQVGRVYVSDYGNARVEVFTGDGTFLTQWTTLAHGFSTPVGIAVSASGDVYVVEHSVNRVQVFSNDGAFLRLWGASGSGPGQFSQPFGIALGPDGTVFVADGVNRRLQQFASDSTFLRQWPTVDGGVPMAVAVDPAGRVYVGVGSQVQVYSSTGTFLRSISAPAGVLPIAQARGVAVTSDRVLVADAGRFRVLEFTSSGVYVREVGRPTTDLLANPTALCVDPSGSVLVTDTDHHRIVKLGDRVVPIAPTTWGRLKVLYR